MVRIVQDTKRGQKDLPFESHAPLDRYTARGRIAEKLQHSYFAVHRLAFASQASDIVGIGGQHG